MHLQKRWIVFFTFLILTFQLSIQNLLKEKEAHLKKIDDATDVMVCQKNICAGVGSFKILKSEYQCTEENIEIIVELENKSTISYFMQPFSSFQHFRLTNKQKLSSCKKSRR